MDYIFVTAVRGVNEDWGVEVSEQSPFIITFVKVIIFLLFLI